MKYILLITLSLMLSACSPSKPYLNILLCYNEKAYIIKDAIGDLVWLEPLPIANIQCTK